METWIWMFTRSVIGDDEGEKQKRAAMRLAAVFITKSLARREQGPLVEPGLPASPKPMEAPQDEEEEAASDYGDNESDRDNEEEEYVEVWGEDGAGESHTDDEGP